MAVTLKQIAQEANVTVASVSLALRGRTDRVSPDTMQRIKRIAKQMDYHPNTFARSLSTNKSNTIGIAMWSIDTIQSSYFSLIASNIVPIAAKRDFSIQFVVTDDDIRNPLRNLSFIKKVKENALDGLIIIDQRVDNEKLLWLNHLDMPFVLVDRYIPGEKVPCVRIDNTKGLFLATKHLIDLGHNRIAFYPEAPLSFNKMSDMLDGYQHALSAAGLQHDKELIYSRKENAADTDVRSVTLSVVDSFLSLPAPPTAIIASSDLIAADVVGVLRARGINIPGDIAVVGYNNDPSFSHLDIGLTTIGVPLDLLGKKAADMLFTLMRNGTPDNFEIIISPELVIQDSCGYKYMTQAK